MYTHLGYTGNHVVDMAAHGTNASQLLPVAKPYLHTELFALLAKCFHLHIDVFELLYKSSSCSFDSYSTRFDGNSD